MKKGENFEKKEQDARLLANGANYQYLIMVHVAQASMYSKTVMTDTRAMH